MLLSSSKTSDHDKVNQDIRFLIQCLREVLEEVGEEELAEILPWQEHTSTGLIPDTTKLIQLYSIAFQLLNAVEENAVVQYRRQLELQDNVAYFSGLWSQTLHYLKDKDLTEDQLLDILARTRVEPVLTAHPTEAKRFSVLEQHRNLYLLLVKRENQIYTPQEQRDIRDEIKIGLERLWRTGEIYLEKPDVASEVRNILYYLRNVFPDVIQSLDHRLMLAWIEAGFDHKRQPDINHLPQLSFGTWVGGDRDGHPLVTSEVTQQTLFELRDTALNLVREQLIELAKKLSLSTWLQATPPTLQETITTLSEDLGSFGQDALDRNPDEPWRQYVNLMVARLPVTSTNDASNHALTYKTATDLVHDLHVLYNSLHSVQAGRLATADVLPVIRIVQTFGFHMATLDIRQNSHFHDLAVAQLMVASGMDGDDFPNWDEGRRLAFLNQELRTNRPFTLPGMKLGAEADAVINCYRVLANYIAQFGASGLGALIVSMTRSLSDLLVVYLLAREGGLMTSTPEGLVCQLPVVPLFETINDLERSPAILTDFLEHPITQRSLNHNQIAGENVQQVMIGYSDSNKDGGIFASLWHLDQAQRMLTAVGRQYNVRVRFFHGRGGSISRGAGPTHRFIRAMPGGTLGGDLRLTEQGEIIARRYANRLTAINNLELFLSGTARNLAKDHYLEIPTRPDLETIMASLAKASSTTYRELLETPHFIDFYRQATPIDVIELSRIGSRPARRTGKHTLADLRAIPWVFSWSQSRFFLSGWYGVGSALTKLQSERPDDFSLIQANAFDYPPLHYIISSVASNLMLTDSDLMRHYATLVGDDNIRELMLKQILEELERTREVFQTIYGGMLSERRPNVNQIIQLRREPLKKLHTQQIDLLSQWRKLKSEGSQAEPILLELLLSVNAIANGLGTTG